MIFNTLWSLSRNKVLKPRSNGIIKVYCKREGIQNGEIDQKGGKEGHYIL